MEYQVDIAGVMYGMHDIQAATIQQPLFDKLSVGNACSAELDISIWPKEEIPRMAKLTPYCRTDASHEWVKLGGFYIDTREQTGDLMSIVSYDAMLKAEVIWTPRSGFTFPCTMEEAVTDAAASMGVALDSRNVFQPYEIASYPMGDYSRRDLLKDVAAAHAGNWIVTGQETLLLVPLFTTLPPETHYLVTEDGSAILFGGTRILV